MAKKILIEEPQKERAVEYCKELEAGNILFFPKIPFPFPQEELDFLLKQKQGSSKGRKNIAYKPESARITNHAVQDPEQAKRLQETLQAFSERASLFLSEILAPYAPHWKRDYASFRPFQELGRKLRIRARNDLLHVDAFPTRPLHGDRIFRFFININPVENRQWVTSEPFAELVTKYGALGVGFPKSVGYSWKERIGRKIKLSLHKMGLPVPLRSPYDAFMLRMHHFLKENTAFQERGLKDHWDFPPGCCWAVFTDQVSHAALSGQYALEQTFLIPTSALLLPERSPLRVLERVSGKNLVDPELMEASRRG